MPPKRVTNCVLWKLPPEVRKMIFFNVIQEWRDQAQQHESRRLINAGYNRAYGKTDRFPTLERALIADTDLYKQFFTTRVEMLTIRVDITDKATMLHLQSPLARASIRQVELSVRPYKFKADWPEGFNRAPFKRIHHLLIRAKKCLVEDFMLVTPHIQHFTLDLSNPFLKLQENMPWPGSMTEEFIEPTFLHSRSFECFIARSPRLQTITVACAWGKARDVDITNYTALIRGSLGNRLGGIGLCTLDQTPVRGAKQHNLTWEARKECRLTWIPEHDGEESRDEEGSGTQK